MKVNCPTKGSVMILKPSAEHFGRRGEIFDHGVEHGLHALVLERAAAQHRHDFEADGALANRQLDLFLGQALAFEVLVHQLFAGFGRSFHHVLVPLGGFVGQVGGDLFVGEGHALVFLVPEDGFHLHEVDHALEAFLGADRNLDGHRVRLEARLHLFVHLDEVGAAAVHLVDEREARHLVLGGLAPHGFRLRLHTAHRAVHHAGAVEHTHGTLHLDGEVHVPGDAAFLFLLHPVHGGSAIMHFTNLVADAGVEQHALSRRGLPSVNVS